MGELLRLHEYERQRLGQELHDSAGQLLVALQLSIAHLRDVEISFQEMIAALRVRLELQGGAPAGTGEPALGSAGTAVDLPS